jgi:hypothetical protein
VPTARPAAAPAILRQEKPAPADPRAGSAVPGGRAVAERPRHTTPNPLLREKLAPQVHGGPKPEPNLSALCQSFIDKPNPYRDPAPNVDAVNNDAIVRAGTQAGCSSAQNETTIAVNHTNPRNLVVGSNDYRTFNTRTQRNDASGWALSTFDGGRTWTNVQLPHLVFQTGGVGALSHMDAAGDPVVAFGPGNTVYYANLVFSRAAPPTGQQVASGLAVSVSRDGGRTWGEPSIVELDGVNPDGTPTPAYVFHDKEWITADPYSGTVHITWTKFTYNTAGEYLESPIMAKSSHDFGRTWSEATRVAPKLDGFEGGITPFDQGSNPQIGRDGTLYVAYEASVCATAACTGADDHDAVVVATSRDGGRTFRNEEVARDFNFPATLTGENFRLNGFPLMAYDRHADQLWITWADDRNGRYDADGKSIRTNGDVFVVRSERGGRGWSEPAQLGTATDEFFPAVAVVAGRVAVSYYTRNYDPYGVGLDYAYSVGWGTGVARAPVQRLTTQTSDPRIQFVAAGPNGEEIQGVFIGDYTGIAMGFDFRAHPCWVDFRGNPGVTKPNQDVYTQSVRAL